MLRALMLISAIVAATSDNCVPRSFGCDRIVCVCNATYCDSPEQSTLNEGQYQWYTSTKNGERLLLFVNNFDKKSNGTILTVDETKKFQTILGFGGAITDSAAINIRSLSNRTQKNLLESYFGPNGIRYSMVRIPIAGTDFSTRPYTYDDTPNDKTLSHFHLVEEDEYKIEYLHLIKNMMPDNDTLGIFTTSWSAPAWMKTSNDITHGFLKPEYYQLYAEYWKKFFDAYKERGIHIWGLTPGNEPTNGFDQNFHFNSMGWTPKDEAHWAVNHLHPTLSVAGYNPVYMLMDEKRSELPRFVDDAFFEERVNKLFSGIAYHWYTNSFVSPLKLNEIYYKYPDKFLLMTEACSGFPGSDSNAGKVILGSWDRGQDYILDIIENFDHWVSGWIDWNIALDEQGGPNWIKNFVDSPIIVNATNDEFYKQPMFYALAHFSKFVPRGSHRISATGIEKESNIKAAAFLTPDKKIVIVAVNKGDKPFDITIKDKSTNRKMNLQLPANSFNTLLYFSRPKKMFILLRQLLALLRLDF